ncbi:MAG: caspase [Proteobacteria bacterium]|nr:caspase [Pseudomonadota bacterium]
MTPLFSLKPLVLCTTILLFGLGSSQAETRAVVVGIDTYQTLTPLRGAEADARDIRDTLKKRRVEDLTVLLNDEADRSSILDSIDAVIDRAKPDDFVILSFAGHGGQLKWGKIRPAYAKEGDHYEAFLLGRFSAPDSQGKPYPDASTSPAERIAGVEMNIRLRELNQKGVRTIFVIDTCFADGLTREPYIGSPDTARTFRGNIPIMEFQNGLDPLAASLAALPQSQDPDQFKSVVVLAAESDNNTTPEVELPEGSGKRRGALSYTFARLLDGSQDVGANGIVNRSQLVGYIRSKVSINSENLQTPETHPRSDPNALAIDFAKDFGAVTMAKPDQAIAAVRMFISGSGEALPPSPRPEAFKIVGASSADSADLIYEGEKGEVYSAQQDLVATDVSLDGLKDVAASTFSIRRLVALNLVPHPLSLLGGDKRYRNGERLVIDARPADDAEYFALFDINGNGIVQLLYPLEDRKDSLLLDGSEPFRGMKISPPFGRDTVVLVTDKKPLTELITSLNTLNSNVAPLEAVDFIEKYKTDSMRLGIQAFFTGTN